MYSFSTDGAYVLQPEDDKENALPIQRPPRRPRDEPAAPVRSFHSYKLPLMSKAPYALAPPLLPTVVTLPVWPFQTAAEL